MPRLARSFGLSAASLVLLAGCFAEEPKEVAPWSKSYGVTGQQASRGLAINSFGDIAMTGSFSTEIDFGEGSLESAGGADIFVATVDASGKHRWSGRTGSDGLQAGSAIGFAPNGDVVAAGVFSGEIDFGGGKLTASNQSGFLVRFDEAGAPVWTKQLGDGEGYVGLTGIAVDAQGNTTVGGFYWEEANVGGDTFTSAGNATFIARYDADGHHVWSRAFGGSGHEVSGVAVDRTGAVFVTGINNGLLDVGGEPIQSSGTSVFVAKLDSAGEPEWVAQLGTSAYSQALGIATDPLGDVVVTGTFEYLLEFGATSYSSVGYPDAFVCKLSSLGKPLWFNQYGLEGSIASGVAIDAGGRIAFTGSYYGNLDLGGGLLPTTTDNHVYVGVLDATGHHLASRSFDGLAQYSYGTAVAFDPAGDLVLTGTYSGDITFGQTTLSSPDGQDIFVARLANPVR